MAVTESPSPASLKRETIMKKIFVLLALAFAFTTGMAVATVIADINQAARTVEIGSVNSNSAPFLPSDDAVS
jgi:FtsH-binding integral membrane protein